MHKSCDADKSVILKRSYKMLQVKNLKNLN